MLLCVTMKTKLHWEKSIIGIQSKTSAYEKQMGKWQLWDQLKVTEVFENPSYQVKQTKITV